MLHEACKWKAYLQVSVKFRETKCSLNKLYWIWKESQKQLKTIATRWKKCHYHKKYEK